MQAYQMEVQAKDAQMKEVNQAGKVAMLEGKLAKTNKNFQVRISQNTSHVECRMLASPLALYITGVLSKQLHHPSQTCQT